MPKIMPVDYSAKDQAINASLTQTACHPRFVALCFFIVVLTSGTIAGQKIETLRLEPAQNMTRAELHYIKVVPNPKAILVLCPGCNSSGDGFLHLPQWIEFAKEHHLGLVGLSFASPTSAIHDGIGYYYASKGSGQKLLEGLRQIFGSDLPVLLYGFSGGAHFTSRFEEWKPGRVLAWCAYSAGWWDEPHPNAINPPGIVACGEEDPRYGASLVYFKQGRAAGKPWLWISLPKTGHNGNAQLDDFVRSYFSEILSSRNSKPLLVDIDREIIVQEDEIYPSLTASLPEKILYETWKDIHAP